MDISDRLHSFNEDLMAPIESDDTTVPVKKMIQPHEVDGALDSLWVSFCRYVGLPYEGHPNPNSGYKFETDTVKRDSYLGKAIRMRNKYAALVARFGKGRERLAQMTKELSELGNRGTSMISKGKGETEISL